MNALFADLKLALRRLRQRPGFTLAAAFALALGIGSTTAVYSVVQAVILRPLQFRNPDQLLLLAETQPAVPNASISVPDFKDWRDQAKTVELSAFTGDGFNLTGRDRAERLPRGGPPPRSRTRASSRCSASAPCSAARTRRARSAKWFSPRAFSAACSA